MPGTIAFGIQGCGKGWSWELGCQELFVSWALFVSQALFLSKRQKWRKFPQKQRKITEDSWKWQQMAEIYAKMTGRDRKWQTFSRFPRHIGTSDARHLNVSSALLALAIVNIQVTHYTIITVKYCRHATQTLSHCFRFSCCKHIGNCLKAVTKLSHKLSPSCRHQHHHN